MSVVHSSIEWLDCNDSMQCQWFLKHMKRKGLLPSRGSELGTDYEKCVSIIKDQSYPSHLNEFFPKLKSAWSSFKNKNKDGNKSYSFVMSDKVDSKLNTLAKEQGFTRNKALELLLNKQYSKEIRAKAQREKRREFEQEQFRHGLKRAAIYAEHNKLKKDNIKNVEELQSLKLITVQQRSKIFEYTIKLESAGSELIEEKLSDEQKKQLDDMILEANEYNEQASKEPTILVEISVDHKSQLNQLANSNKMDISEMLEHLIEAGHEELPL